MKTRTREIARAGIFGSKDNTTIVTEAELKQIEETFPDVKKAPVKLGGHWSEDRPRLGNVTSVRYDKKTKTLFGTIEEQDALAKAVDEDGYYPDVSIGAKTRASDGKMYLHHLAYLGSEPPAIKDLENKIAEDLSEAEKNAAKIAAEDTGEFREFPSANARQLLLSDPTNEAQKNENTSGVAAIEGDTNAPSIVGMSGGTPKELSMTEEEIKAMRAENERLKTEAAEREKMLSDRMESEKASMKNALKKAASGKVTVPQMEKLMALADSFDAGKTIELSDGDGKKRSEHPLSVLADIFSSLPDKVQEGQLNLSDTGEIPKPENLSAKMMGNI